MNPFPDLSPILACLAIVVVFLALRTRASERSEVRAHQLDNAGRFLDLHERALARFLNDPASGPILRKTLIRVSDRVMDRPFAKEIIERIISAEVEPASTYGEADRIKEELAFLAKTRPDLREDFTDCIIAGVMGVCLRWPETADLFERWCLRLAETPRQDVAVAVTRANYWPDMSLGLPPSMRPAH